MVLCARVRCVAASWLPLSPPPQNDGHDGRLSKDSVTQLAGALLSVPRVRSPLLETIAGTATCCLPSPPPSFRNPSASTPSAVRPFVRARRATRVKWELFPSPPPVTPLRFRPVGRDELCLCLWFYFYLIFPSSSCIMSITHLFFPSLFFGWLYIANINSILSFKEKNPDFYAMV
jgi:hypothetical protein